MDGGEIIVDIGVKGEVKVSVKGTAGADCVKMTESLEKSLGTTTSDRKTSEYRQGGNKNVARRTG